LRQAISAPGGASTTFGTLSDIGIEFQKDGTIKLNDTKVAAAMTKLPELTAAMTTLNVGMPAKNGFAVRIDAWADKLLDTNGSLPGKTKSIQSQIASNAKDQEKMSDRLEAIEARIRAQYTALDSTMSKANALSKYVQQQITTWNQSTS
jgi:flagellar hook-associated protein 2